MVLVAAMETPVPASGSPHSVLTPTSPEPASPSSPLCSPMTPTADPEPQPPVDASPLGDSPKVVGLSVPAAKPESTAAAHSVDSAGDPAAPIEVPPSPVPAVAEVPLTPSPAPSASERSQPTPTNDAISAPETVPPEVKPIPKPKPEMPASVPEVSVPSTPTSGRKAPLSPKKRVQQPAKPPAAHACKRRSFCIFCVLFFQ